MHVVQSRLRDVLSIGAKSEERVMKDDPEWVGPCGKHWYYGWGPPQRKDWLMRNTEHNGVKTLSVLTDCDKPDYAIRRITPPSFKDVEYTMFFEGKKHEEYPVGIVMARAYGVQFGPDGLRVTLTSNLVNALLLYMTMGERRRLVAAVMPLAYARASEEAKADPKKYQYDPEVELVNAVIAGNVTVAEVSEENWYSKFVWNSDIEALAAISTAASTVEAMIGEWPVSKVVVENGGVSTSVGEAVVTNKAAAVDAGGVERPAEEPWGGVSIAIAALLFAVAGLYRGLVLIRDGKSRYTRFAHPERNVALVNSFLTALKDGSATQTKTWRWPWARKKIR